MRASWLVAYLLASGCNSLLGLDRADVDHDGDGIVDETDNCPAAANPDQLDDDADGVGNACDNCVALPNTDQIDRDGDRRGDACDSCPAARPTRDRDNDGVDDACDPCLLGPQVDDEGDQVSDACDLCPGTPTTTEADRDGDLVGDACDPSNEPSRRAAFEPFHDLAGWTQAGQWRIGADGSSAVAIALDTSGGPAAMSATNLGIGSLRRLAARLDLLPDSSALMQIGPEGTRCRATCATGTCTLELAVPQQPVEVSLPFSAGAAELAFSFTPPNLIGPQGPSRFECAAIRNGAPVATATLFEVGLGGDRPDAPILAATPGVTVWSLDAIE